MVYYEKTPTGLIACGYFSTPFYTRANSLPLYTYYHIISRLSSLFFKIFQIAFINSLFIIYTHPVHITLVP